MRAKPVRIETRVFDRYVYAIITDPNSGRNGRYTVHRIQLFGFSGTKVVGCELPLNEARRLVQRYADNKHRRPNFLETLL